MALIFCSMQVKNRPFLLSPAAKDYIWGGTRLREEYNKHIDVTPLAETWECSTHPDGPSRVASGAFAGEKLVDVLRAHPEFIGTHPKTDGEGGLPVLIKFIDAARDLSVQVHPSDEYARTHEHGQLGKTEMWYVLEAAPGASLVYGFRRDLTRAMLAASLEDDTVEQYLQKVEIHRGDVFLIESGTVHAIGAGAMIVEIQESSNLTYRMYDYHRLGKDGKPRELHIAKALDVVDLRRKPLPEQLQRVREEHDGYSVELLEQCKYFRTERLRLDTVQSGKEPSQSEAACSVEGTSTQEMPVDAHETNVDNASAEMSQDASSQWTTGEKAVEVVRFSTGPDSFEVLLCVDGSGTLRGEDVEISFRKGDCIFVPADSIGLEIRGTSELLKVTC